MSMKRAPKRRANRAAVLAAILMMLPFTRLAGEDALSIYNWRTRVEDAIAHAEETGRTVLVYFAGSDWCGWCERFHREIVETDAFQRFLDDELVPVLIDFPRRREIDPEQARYNRELAERLRVSGYPTVILISTEGRVLLRTGYIEGGAEAYIERLQLALE